MMRNVFLGGKTAKMINETANFWNPSVTFTFKKNLCYYFFE